MGIHLVLGGGGTKVDWLQMVTVKSPFDSETITQVTHPYFDTLCVPPVRVMLLMKPQ